MRKTWLIVTLMLIIIGCSSNPSMTAIKIYRVQWYEKHDMHILKKWKTLAEKETVKNPNNSEAWFYLGEAYVNLGEQLGKPDSLIKGARLVKKGFDIDSTKILKMVKGNEQAYWGIFKNVTDRLIQKENYKTAQDFLNIAFRILPDRAENWTMKGFLSLKDADTTKALQSYIKATKLDSQNVDAFGTLGRIYSIQGKSDSANYYFSIADRLMELKLSRAIKMVVPDREISETRGPVIKASILFEKKKTVEAQKALSQFGITDLEPKKRVLNRLTNLRYDMGSLLFQIGLDEFQRGKNEAAIKRLTAVQEVWPGHTGARYYVGLSKYKLKRYKDAEQEFRVLSEQKPDDFRAWFYLGVSIAQQERYRDALEPFEKALKVNPRSADTYRNLALIYSKIGEKKKAVECYRKAQEIEKGGK